MKTMKTTETTVTLAPRWGVEDREGELFALAASRREAERLADSLALLLPSYPEDILGVAEARRWRATPTATRWGHRGL